MTEKLAIAFLVFVAVVFPVWAAYYASKHKRKGWATASIISIILGLGPIVGLCAIVASSRERELTNEVKCPNCGEARVWLKTATVSRETGKAVSLFGRPFLGLIFGVGGILLAYSGVTLLTVGLPEADSSIETVYRLVGGVGLLVLGVGVVVACARMLVGQLRGRVTTLFRYECAKCSHRWEQQGDGEKAPTAVINPPSDDGARDTALPQ